MTETLTPNSYDSLFDPENHDLDPPANTEEANRMVEAAAVRTPSLAEVLRSVGKGNFGFYRPNEEQGRQIVEAFSAFEGFGAAVESKEEMQKGIGRARQFVENGRAQNYLRKLPFVDDTRAGYLSNGVRPQKVFLKDDFLVISPDKIVGAGGFLSWLGRGHYGEGGVHDRDNKATVGSFDKIMDFATRETELPPLNDIRIFLTDKGVFAYSNNSHRTAAAKLRDERLKVSGFEIYDFRGRHLSGLQQRVIEEMQATASDSN